MTEELSIIASNKLMGRVKMSGNRFSFHYAPSWQESVDSYPLSISMPLAIADHPHSLIDPFIRGLLPDNTKVLEQWGKRFHVSSNNPFRLLQHVGEDCAGAVQFVSPEREHEWINRAPAHNVTYLSDDELATRIQLLLKHQGTTRISTDSGQFSLAGAQPKIALYYDSSSKRWGVPQGSTPTTHILKPSIGDFEGYAENEHFCLKLASDLGLTAASSSVMRPSGHPVIVSKRYDRMIRGKHFIRIHQEDMCQALAISPNTKYQNEGGPSVKQVAGVLWDVSSDALTDVLRFADALIFNWLIFGTDAHAKNYSLLIADKSQIRLAPLYDLASALPYPKEINPHKAKMSMRIGSKYQMKHIQKNHWESCARDLRLPANILLDRVKDLADQIPTAAEVTANKLRDEKLMHPIIPKLAKSISERSGHCLQVIA